MSKPCEPCIKRGLLFCQARGCECLCHEEMSKPDEIVAEMKKRDKWREEMPAKEWKKQAWIDHAYQYIPHSLKLLAKKDREIERLKFDTHNARCIDGQHARCLFDADACECHDA